VSDENPRRRSFGSGFGFKCLSAAQDRGLKWSSPLIGPPRPVRTCRPDPQFRLLTRYTLPPSPAAWTDRAIHALLKRTENQRWGRWGELRRREGVANGHAEVRRILHLARIYLEASAAPARYHRRVTCLPPAAHSLPLRRLSPFILFSIASHLGPPILAKQRATGHARVSDARRFIFLPFSYLALSETRNEARKVGASFSRPSLPVSSLFQFPLAELATPFRMDDPAIPRALLRDSCARSQPTTIARLGRQLLLPVYCLITHPITIVV
jgi:hypothetical protein